MIKYWLFETFYERRNQSKEQLAELAQQEFGISLVEYLQYYQEFISKTDKEQLIFYIECLKKDILYHDTLSKMSSQSVIMILKARLEQANELLTKWL